MFDTVCDRRLLFGVKSGFFLGDCSMFVIVAWWEGIMSNTGDGF